MEREAIERRTDRSFHQADSPLCPPAMSTPYLAATADCKQGNKNYLLTCNVNALVAETANRELENKNYWLACCDVYALVGCDR
jgi:hypothetical protein